MTTTTPSDDDVGDDDAYAALSAFARTDMPDDLAGRAAYVSALADLVDAAGLGDDGVAVATDLRAALGAIVAWGRGPRSQASTLELVSVMAVLLRRASARLYARLANDWADVAAAGAAGDAGAGADDGAHDGRPAAYAATFRAAHDAIVAGDDDVGPVG